MPLPLWGRVTFTATKLIKVPDAHRAGEGEKNKREPGHIYAVD